MGNVLNYTNDTDVLLHSIAWNPTSKFVAVIIVVAIIVITATYFTMCFKVKKKEVHRYDRHIEH